MANEFIIKSKQLTKTILVKEIKTQTNIIKDNLSIIDCILFAYQLKPVSASLNVGSGRLALCVWLDAASEIWSHRHLPLNINHLARPQAPIDISVRGAETCARRDDQLMLALHVKIGCQMHGLHIISLAKWYARNQCFSTEIYVVCILCLICERGRVFQPRI